MKFRLRIFPQEISFDQEVPPYLGEFEKKNLWFLFRCFASNFDRYNLPLCFDPLDGDLPLLLLSLEREWENQGEGELEGRGEDQLQLESTM